MYRASALAEAKLAGEYFDEDFGSYKEDIDLGWRMRRLGMRVSLVPGAVAWHHRSAPSARQGLFWLKAFFRRFKKPKRINFGSTRNHCWLTWKNDELVNRLVHAPWIVPYEASKLISYILTPSSFKAVFAAWGGYFKMKKKREELKKRAKVSGLEMRKWYV